MEGDTHLRFEQRFPLKELTDVYDRKKKRRNKTELKKLTWDDAIFTCEYSFDEKAITMCRSFQEGDPSRKRFIYIVKDFEGLYAITFFFKRKHVNVYLKGGDQEAFDKLVSKLLASLASNTGSWRDEYRIQITDEEKFTAFLSLDQRFIY